MQHETWNWFDLNFPWIGLGIAAILASLLFGTNLLRHNMTQSRWRDPVWLSWLGMLAYLIHNVEEYGLDILGQHHAFPDALCTNIGLGAYPACPVPPAFYLAVNITMFWLVAPLAALLARRYPLAGLSVYSVIFINALVHIAPMLATQSYNPGALSALVIFLPLSLWVAHTCFGADKLSYQTLAWLVATGIIVHVILAGSVLLFTHGFINATTLILTQIVNAGLVLVIPWAGTRHKQNA
ncbi:MAG: HXXEE domain-containing protein [Parvibaculaceae bacterium]